MEYVKLLQECEEGEQRRLESENGYEKVNAKIHGLKIKIEEIFTFVKDQWRV